MRRLGSRRTSPRRPTQGRSPSPSKAMRASARSVPSTLRGSGRFTDRGVAGRRLLDVAFLIASDLRKETLRSHRAWLCDRDVGRIRGHVASFDQQPLLWPGANEGPASFELSAVEREAQLALLQRDGGVYIVEHLVRPLVPDHHRSAAVLALGDHALESRVLERVVLDLHRESLLARIE